MRWILKAVLAVVLLFQTNILLSQEAPQGIYYQAVARGESGSELIESSLDVRINIEDENNIVYTEIHNPTTDSFGLFELFIGGGQVEFGTFSSISWGTENHFLNVELDLGDGFIDVSTTQLLSVPYSLYSARAATADDVNDADADPVNELVQNFSINGTALELTDSGNTWSIPLIEISDDEDWDVNSGNSTLSTEGYSVGINTTNPSSTLEVNGSFGLTTLRVNSIPGEIEIADLGVNNSVVLCNVVAGAIQVNLPNAELCAGRTYFLKRYDSSTTNFGFSSSNGTLTIQAMEGQSIDNNQNIVLGSNTWEQISVISDGQNWFILSYNTNP